MIWALAEGRPWRDPPAVKETIHASGSGSQKPPLGQSSSKNNAGWDSWNTEEFKATDIRRNRWGPPARSRSMEDIHSRLQFEASAANKDSFFARKLAENIVFLHEDAIGYFFVQMKGTHIGESIFGTLSLLQSGFQYLSRCVHYRNVICFESNLGLFIGEASLQCCFLLTFLLKCNASKEELTGLSYRLLGNSDAREGLLGFLGCTMGIYSRPISFAIGPGSIISLLRSIRF